MRLSARASDERTVETLRLRHLGMTLAEIVERLGWSHESGPQKAISRVRDADILESGEPRSEIEGMY